MKIDSRDNSVKLLHAEKRMLAAGLAVIEQRTRFCTDKAHEPLSNLAAEFGVNANEVERYVMPMPEKKAVSACLGLLAHMVRYQVGQHADAAHRELKAVAQRFGIQGNEHIRWKEDIPEVADKSDAPEVTQKELVKK